MTPLRVGIDVSPLSLTRAGTARYVVNLTEQLADEPALELHRYGFAGRGRAHKVARDVVWYHAALPALARRDGLDVLHCPAPRAPLRPSTPLVVTIHDVAVLRHPDTFNRWTRTYSAFALPRIARAAAKIVVGSRFVREEVMELLHVPADKVRIVPYGVGPPFTADGAASEGNFVLAVSTLEPRKNLARLLEGFRRAELDGCELRLVGASGWGGVRVEGEKVRWLGEVDDEELARLYRGARCVAYFSLYEGFGLPVLEAMACGAPVVTSDAPPFREFAEGIAVAVPATDPDGIAAGLREAVARRNGHAALARERAAAYSWERTAKSTLEVYREAAA